MRPILFSLLVLGLAALAAADTTIDNPADGNSAAGHRSDGLQGPFSLGQSFTAPTGEHFLTEFTLYASGMGANDTGVFQVYTLSGDTLGALLYESPSFDFDANYPMRSFTPNVAVTPESTYIALLTSTQGGVGALTGQPYAGGAIFTRSGNDPLEPFPFRLDLAFRATFANVQATPEPVTMTLGIAAFGAALKRRRRA